MARVFATVLSTVTVHPGAATVHSRQTSRALGSAFRTSLDLCTERIEIGTGWLVVWIRADQLAAKCSR